jgi:hypothetical protein
MLRGEQRNWRRVEKLGKSIEANPDGLADDPVSHHEGCDKDKGTNFPSRP